MEHICSAPGSSGGAFPKSAPFLRGARHEFFSEDAQAGWRVLEIADRFDPAGRFSGKGGENLMGDVGAGLSGSVSEACPIFLPEYPGLLHSAQLVYVTAPVLLPD